MWVDPDISDHPETISQTKKTKIENFSVFIKKKRNCLITALPQFGLTSLAHKIALDAWINNKEILIVLDSACLLYTSPSPRDQRGSRMPSSA